MDVAGIDEGVEIRVNGALAGKLSPTKLKGDAAFEAPVKGAETKTFKIRPPMTQRLNHIELASTQQSNGKPDRFCLLDLRVKFQDKVYRDTRFRLSAKTPVYIGSKELFLVDLTPGK
jgi:hypothetical protein